MNNNSNTGKNKPHAKAQGKQHMLEVAFTGLVRVITKKFLDFTAGLFQPVFFYIAHAGIIAEQV